MNATGTMAAPSRDTGPVAVVLSSLILCGGIATIALAAYLVVRCYTPLPWSDGWTEIFMGARGDPVWSLHWLWQQHNEHRLLIPKLFLAIDLGHFAGTQVFLLSAIFIIQLLHFALLSWSMPALGDWRGSLWLTGSGVAAFCLFCPAQWENLTWGFQTCFVLPPLFATVAFISFVLYCKGGQATWIALSIAAGVCASCSLANGLLVLPLLLVAALAMRLRLSVAMTYLAAAGLTMLAYFHHFVRPPHESDPLHTIHAPLRILSYVATYFGSSWTYGASWTHHNLQIAPVAGAVGLGLAALFLSRARRIEDKARGFGVLLLLLLAFCLGTSVMTALGRMMSGNEQAFAPRYQTIALLFWFAVGCLLLAQLSSTRPGLVMVQLAVAAVFLRGATLAHFAMRDATEHAFQQRAATAALITGVADREQIQHAYQFPDAVLAAVPYMRENRLSIFSKPQFPALGSSTARLKFASPDECRGSLQSGGPIGDSKHLRIAGWAWNVPQDRPAVEMLAVSSGQVVGVGASGDWRPTIRGANQYMNTSFVGFTAYAKVERSGDPVTVYAVVEREPMKICQIASYSEVK